MGSLGLRCAEWLLHVRLRLLGLPLWAAAGRGGRQPSAAQPCPAALHAGERLPRYIPAFLQPFTPYDVVSFSEVSAVARSHTWGFEK